MRVSPRPLPLWSARKPRSPLYAESALAGICELRLRRRQPSGGL